MTASLDQHHAPAWLSDRDREEIEHIEPPAAWALSFLFGGGGQILVRDYRKGAALLLADLLAIVLLPAGAGFLAWLMIGTASSIYAVRQARSVNHYTTARVLTRQAILASLTAPSANPELAGRAERLRKLADLRRAGVLSEIEHRERKFEILAELAELTLTHREDLLHDLLVLQAQGVVDDDELRFVKDLGA